MNQNRKDRDVRNREDQIDDMTRERGSSMHTPSSERGRGSSSDDTSGMGSSGERNRGGSDHSEDRSDDKATGISNRGLERELDEQHRVPDRGMRKSEA